MIVSGADNAFPKETSLLGRILLGYSDLEFELMSCLEAITGDSNLVIKTMFRTRGETQRIDIADAIGRHQFDAVGLGTDFAMAVGNMRHCLKIRNQYAHCIWHVNDRNILFFTNLEELAIQNTKLDEKSLWNLYPIGLELLELQFAYIEHVIDCLKWLAEEVEVRRGVSAQNRVQKPAQLKRPLLRIR